MTGIIGRILLFVVLVAVSMAALKEAMPRMAEPNRFWLSVLGLGLLFWLFRPKPPVTEEPPPPSLEQLEQKLIARPALKWEKRKHPLAQPDAAKAAYSGARKAEKSVEEQPDATRADRAPDGPWGRAQEAGKPDVRPASGQGAPVQRDDATPQKAGGWVPKEESATVQNLRIGGLIYVGTAPRTGNGRARGWIDPALSARAATRDPGGRNMPYWPNYQDLSAENRATYLDWLADGRQDASYNPGYMFMYFYGLERRFLNDTPSAIDQREILAEVACLRDLWSSSGSARRYLGEFLDYARATLGEDLKDPPSVERGWELPLRLKVALGARLLRGQALSAEWLLVWLKAHPETRLRTAATRCGPEFDALFQRLFTQRFPEGLVPRTPRKLLEASYRAASGDFEVGFQPQLDGRRLPDVSGLLAPVEVARDIADKATEQLERLSRFLGRTPHGRGTLEAAALVPPQIADLFPSEGLAALADWAGGVVATGGLVPVEDLLARLEGEVPKRIGRRQLADAGAAIARIGYGLAPDAEFSLRAPRIGEPVVIFSSAHPPASPDAAPSEAFRNALLHLALRAAVVQADGVVLPTEREALEAGIAATPGLAPGEEARLRANLNWLLAVPPDMGALRARLSAASPEATMGLRAALIVTAANGGGTIDPAEVTQIERLYRMMGMDASQAYSDLHAGAVMDAPVTVRRANLQAQGEAIPEVKAQPAHRMALDADRIAAIRADTEAVSKVLGAIFTGDSEEVGQEAAADQGAEQDRPAVLAGLEPRQAAFLREVITRPVWPEDDMAALAARHGLMTEGAVEAVNEWAFAGHDEALLEYYGDYEVSAAIAVALTAALQEDGNVDTQTA
jgi:TerB N-terminal domain/TerB-C domain/Tellurite resistance protein TerB